LKKILIIEDDTAIAEIERDFLEINGFITKIEKDGIAALKRIRDEQFDLILLDLMLPGMDGYEICRKVRAEIDIPILMVTAKTENIDKIRGLGLGADDYISKPFSPTELVARVKANLAQFERLTGNKKAKKTSILNIGSIEVDVEKHRVFVDGQEQELKNKEFELLIFFMTNPEIVFSKETLYERIWGIDNYGDTKTVAVHINRIREKIEKDPSNPVYIQTIWGVGYRFKI
jgi:DNA-binding response OmpR family regulator